MPNPQNFPFSQDLQASVRNLIKLEPTPFMILTSIEEYVPVYEPPSDTILDILVDKICNPSKRSYDPGNFLFLKDYCLICHHWGYSRYKCLMPSGIIETRAPSGGCVGSRILQPFPISLFSYAVDTLGFAIAAELRDYPRIVIGNRHFTKEVVESPCCICYKPGVSYSTPFGSFSVEDVRVFLRAHMSSGYRACDKCTSRLPTIDRKFEQNMTQLVNTRRRLRKGDLW